MKMFTPKKLDNRDADLEAIYQQKYPGIETLVGKYFKLLTILDVIRKEICPQFNLTSIHVFQVGTVIKITQIDYHKNKIIFSMQDKYIYEIFIDDVFYVCCEPPHIREIETLLELSVL